MEAALGASLLLQKKKEDLLFPFLLEQLFHLWVLSPFCSHPLLAGSALLPCFNLPFTLGSPVFITSPDLPPSPLPGISS